MDGILKDKKFIMNMDQSDSNSLFDQNTDRNQDNYFIENEDDSFLSALTQEVLALKQNNIELESLLSREKKSNNALKNKQLLNENEINRLTSQMKDYEDKIKLLTLNSEELNSKNENDSKKLLEMQELFSKSQKNIQQLISKKNQIEKSLNQEINFLKSEINKEKSYSFEINKKLEEEIKTIKFLESDIERAEADIEQLKASSVFEFFKIEEQNKKLQYEIEKLNLQLNQTESKSVSDLNEANAQFIEKLNELNHIIENKNLKINELEKSVVEFKDSAIQSNISYNNLFKLKQETISQLEIKINESQKINDELNVHLENARKDSQIQREFYERSYKSIEKTYTNKLNQANELHLSEVFKLNKAINNLIAEKNILNSELIQNSAFKQDLNEKIENLEMELQNSLNQNKDLHFKHEKEKNALNQSLEKSISAQASLIEEIRQKDNIIFSLENKINDFKDRELKFIEDLNVLNEILNDEKSKSDFFEQKLKTNEGIIDLKNKINFDLEVQLKDERLKVDSLNNQLIESNDLIKFEKSKKLSLENDLKTVNEKLTEKLSLISQMRIALDEAQSKSSSLDKEMIELYELLNLETQKNHSFQKEIQDKDSLINDKNQQIENLEIKIKDLATECKDHLSTIQNLNDKLNEKSIHFNYRAQQLQSITARLNEEKRLLYNTARNLINELQTYKKINPLSDMLNLTQSELDKVENQLKKTPVLSFERSQLEKYIDQLFEQKVFLRNSLDKSNIQLDMQTRSMNQILQNGNFSQLPPVPGDL